MSLDQALAVVKAAGFRVVKPRAVTAARPMLNAIGKPYSPSYDPRYRMKYKAGSTAHLFAPYSPSFREHFVREEKS